jgi:hypothetical protein
MNDKPRYEHTCSNCHFLGQMGKYDLYVCPLGKVADTLVARFSSDGPDYMSGLYFIGIIPEITEAARLAVSAGYSILK